MAARLVSGARVVAPRTVLGHNWYPSLQVCAESCRQSSWTTGRPTAGRARVSCQAQQTRHLISTNGVPGALATSQFPRRHIGPDEADTVRMLAALDPPVKNLDEFVAQVIPPDVLSTRPLFAGPKRDDNSGNKSHHNSNENIEESGSSGNSGRSQPWGLAENVVAAVAQGFGKANIKAKNFIGAGYYGTITPEVIKRNVLDNPAWYTSYTPYQPEISQGRLESLLNFQTMVSDLTGLGMSNASLLDEGTAAAEAMTLSMNALSSSRAKKPDKTFMVSDGVNERTVAVLRGRAAGFGINVVVDKVEEPQFVERMTALGDSLVGVMVQYPNNAGQVNFYGDLADQVHEQGALLSVATDLLALTVLSPPGEWGADIAFGNAQRFGVPMGFGGPHAAFFAVTEKHKRKMPGRLVGVSKDRLGNRALRLALQTREQHIRREKATSNVCTAQALLANMSVLYAIYHGPDGLRSIAERVIARAQLVQRTAQLFGWDTGDYVVDFDTVVMRFDGKAVQIVRHMATQDGVDQPVNALALDSDRVAISVDETTTLRDVEYLFRALSRAVARVDADAQERSQAQPMKSVREIVGEALAIRGGSRPNLGPLERTSAYLTHPVFNTHRSETELLRYMHHLQSKDLSLVHSMIPLGSCTMKLNGSTEMSLISNPKFADLHPRAPASQTAGYAKLISQLEAQLASITAMDGVSLQPNSGAQGEFAGLRVIRKFHESKSRGTSSSPRDICLIPVSAHGTNPASAAMAGLRVVPIKCDTKTGNLDIEDLESKCKQHASQLAAIMITYPSTFGVFEPQIKRVCEIVHEYGGQVYMDGANMNAQIGLCAPGEIGADVCHLNLHKTFCIPHGGGGPGVGPICVKEHLRPFLPSEHYAEAGAASASTAAAAGDDPNTPVSSAPYGSASILPISWAYNCLMGSQGLKHATKVTLLSANYLLARLRPHYAILYTNAHGRCAHEFILDARPFRDSAGIEALDIAKRLQDYGFHAPTMSWPVANTLMVEPTESESLEELDRFVDALVSIRAEIRDVETGKAPRERNVLKMAPHPMRDIVEGDDGKGGWERSYTRETAAYPLPWLKEKKFWPSVARVDDAYGDLNLFCTCPPVQDTTGGGTLSSV